MFSTRKLPWLVLLWLPVALGLSGCGDGNGGGGGTGPSPVPRVVAEGSFSIGTVQTAIATLDPCDFVEFVEFNTNSTGTLEAVVDWTFASNDIDVALIGGRCTCQDVINAPSVDALNQSCPTVAESTAVLAKPERITASNQQAGTYTLVVVNVSDQRESCSYQVVFTPST